MDGEIHRMAALSTLKYRRLTCRYQPGFPKHAGEVMAEGVETVLAAMLNPASLPSQAEGAELIRRSYAEGNRALFARLGRDITALDYPGSRPGDLPHEQGVGQDNRRQVPGHTHTQ